MANVLMTRAALLEAAKPVVDAFRAYCEGQLAEMKPGEKRLIPNPFGRDLMPVCIKKPAAEGSGPE